MLESIHDDGYDYDGFRRDAGDGDLSPLHFHLRCARYRSINQISALLIWPVALDARSHADRSDFCAGRMNDMFAIDAAKRRIAAATSTAVQTLRSKRVVSARFFVGLLAGAGFTAVGLHQVNRTQPDLVLAITLYPVTRRLDNSQCSQSRSPCSSGFCFGASERPQPHSFGACSRATASS